jgi:hypothetical protein
MRVTKLIREYVENAVAERMPMPKRPTDTLREEYEALTESLNAYCRNAIKEFARNHGGEFYFLYSGYDANEVDALISYADHNCDLRYPGLRSVAANDYDKLCKEMKAKRNAIVNDILVCLELGANRAELEEMLAEVGKDENLL